MFAGFHDDWNIMGYWINVTSIPGGVTEGKPHDRYLIRFKEKLVGYDQKGRPLILIISHSVNIKGKFEYRFEGNSPTKGLDWEEFITIVGSEIDKRRTEIEFKNSEQNSALT
jgi:hypothetical protein